jgi:hypothetical protein
MKPLMFTLLACASTFTVAAQMPATDDNAVVEHYNYSMHLDIAKVVAIDPVPNVCEAVPVHMVYDDSQGKRHVLEYQVMGNGCTD